MDMISTMHYFFKLNDKKMMKLHIFFKLDKKIIGNEGLNCLKKIEGRNALKTKRSWILCFNMSKL